MFTPARVMCALTPGSIWMVCAVATDGSVFLIVRWVEDFTCRMPVAASKE